MPICPASTLTSIAGCCKDSTVQVWTPAGQAAYVHVEIQPGFTRRAVLANTAESEYSKQKARLKPLNEWSRDALRINAPPESTNPAESPPALAKQPVGNPKDRHSGRFGDL